MIPHRDRGASGPAVPDHIPSWIVDRYQSEARERVTWSHLRAAIEAGRPRHRERQPSWPAYSHHWTAVLLTITLSVGIIAVIVPVWLRAPFPIVMAAALVSVMAALTAASILQMRLQVRRREAMHPSAP